MSSTQIVNSLKAETIFHASLTSIVCSKYLLVFFKLNILIKHPSSELQTLILKMEMEIPLGLQARQSASK